jgi:hypothetical protein
MGPSAPAAAQLLHPPCRHPREVKNITRREALIAVARAERDKARLRADHLRRTANALGGASPEPVLRQATYGAAAADLDVTIAEARLERAEMEPEGPEPRPAPKKAKGSK